MGRKLLRPGTLHISAGAIYSAGLILAPAAFAHGLSVDDDPNRPLPQYVTLGFEHMATGWDHLLFILGCALIASSATAAAKLISLFVLGHSLTLLVATLAEWKVSAFAVDVVIASSVVFVGALGLWRGQKNWRLIAAIVFGFGLVHGLGLSTRLQEIALPEEGLAIRIGLFNIGIELGQLAVLGAVVALWKLLSRARATPAGVKQITFGAIAAAGLAALFILPFASEQTTAAASESACTEADHSPTVTVGGGGHPPKRFYSPDEPPPRADMDHVIFDGWIIITYRKSLPAETRDALEQWVEERDQAVLASAVEQQQAIRAYTVRRALTCAAVDISALDQFRDTWFGQGN